MEQIHTFAKKVQKAGRVTIPEPVRIILDIQDKDLMYFAVSDRPFKAEPIE
jgi:bifunctional DNA-binding transcriptional regulator/antitoxin component of YhaV-PrlF toxin-antitoxin module